jgi:hypothetical protein
LVALKWGATLLHRLWFFKLHYLYAIFFMRVPLERRYGNLHNGGCRCEGSNCLGNILVCLALLALMTIGGGAWLLFKMLQNIRLLFYWTNGDEHRAEAHPKKVSRHSRRRRSLSALRRADSNKGV